MSNRDRRLQWILGAIGVGAFAGLLTLEAITEPGGMSLPKLLLEATETALVIAAAVGISLLLGRMRAQHEEKLALMQDLRVARAEGAGLRRQVQMHVNGLGAAIERQFRDWNLTEAEREIGLLMLKGLSHREIAALRGTSEATIRQQATSTYNKSGLGGRAAFCAFFLEDLLAPTEATAVDGDRCVPQRNPARRDAGAVPPA